MAEGASYSLYQLFALVWAIAFLVCPGSTQYRALIDPDSCSDADTQRLIDVINEAQAMADHAYQITSMLTGQTIALTPERINAIAATYSVFFGSLLSLDNNNQAQSAGQEGRLNTVLRNVPIV